MRGWGGRNIHCDRLMEGDEVVNTVGVLHWVETRHS
jgi:hypothetical protein